MIWQWTALAVFTLTVLPVAVALLTDRIPRRLRSTAVPTRPWGLALLSLYAVAPINALPRLAGASPAVVLTATVLGGVLAVSGCTLATVATCRARISVR
ncbi:hypothetical protein [Streptomyces sp. NPDC059176]|uniref:hypothetical protein n=1 Tax=unclassified Streptomyces TaxID=2593676 RepID=UPI0036AFF4EF